MSREQTKEHFTMNELQVKLEQMLKELEEMQRKQSCNKNDKTGFRVENQKEPGKQVNSYKDVTCFRCKQRRHFAQDSPMQKADFAQDQQGIGTPHLNGQKPFLRVERWLMS